MRRYGGALLAVLLAAGFVILSIAILGARSLQPPLHASASAGASNHVSITLQTFPFSPYEDDAWIKAHVTGQSDYGYPFPSPGDNQGWVTYWPTTNLTVPAHSLVTITIQNYDTATPLLNSFYGTPQGVLPSSFTVDGKPGGSVNSDDISHTFTIHGIPNATQPWLYVSVPVTAVSGDAPTDEAGMPNKPVVTTFSFMTQGPGTYAWQCFDPCGSNYDGFGGPMETRGYMSGTFTVV